MTGDISYKTCYNLLYKLEKKKIFFFPSPELFSLETLLGEALHYELTAPKTNNN